MKNENTAYAEKILSSYEAKEVTDLDRLRELDKRVKRPVNIFSYVLGSISAVIMGAGMSLIMTEIGEKLGIEATLPIGLTLGIAGLILSLLNYPIYKKAMEKRKKAFAPEITELCNKITNN